MNRRFKASRPNELWVTDFTYVPTWCGLTHTAFVTDVYSRLIVGWRTASSMTAQVSYRLMQLELERLSAMVGTPVAQRNSVSASAHKLYT